MKHVTPMHRRRNDSLDGLLAESLEPRVLYSAAPLADEANLLEVDPSATADGLAIHVSHSWVGSGDRELEFTAAREHELSHLLEQASSGEEWELLSA